MSRRSAVATDTGTTGATFARAEPGLGSLPPQPDRDTLSNRMSPSQEFVGAGNCRRTDSTEGCRKAKTLPLSYSLRPEGSRCHSRTSFRRKE